jgi:thiol:disulfide interchange protein
MSIKTRALAFVVTVFLVACGLDAGAEGVNQKETEIRWQRWSPELFKQAKKENRLVLVDFAADWCHFCKKMDQTTWQDPEVLAAIKADYIPVRVQDEIDTALAEKYRRYGRPAIAILDGDGKEIFKKRGYQEPRQMLWTLQGVVQDASENK